MSNWVTLSRAAKEFNTSIGKITRIARKHNLELRDNPMDERIKLIDLDELKRILNVSNP